MKTLIVYAHLLAACVAIGTLLLQDLALTKTRGRTLSADEIAGLKKSANAMFLALIALWVTGISLVLIGYLENPAQYLTNQKLWAKVSVVVVLTLNGLALHHYSFPRVTCSTGFFSVAPHEQIGVVLTGAVSSVSWLFACYLGIAREWNYSVNYGFIILIYAGLMLCAVVAALVALRLWGTALRHDNGLNQC